MIETLFVVHTLLKFDIWRLPNTQYLRSWRVCGVRIMFKLPSLYLLYIAVPRMRIYLSKRQSP